LGDFFQNIVAFIADPSPRVVILLFLLCAIGEIGMGIPYILESVWLLVGFNLGAGTQSPWFLIMLWLAAQAGRQAGSLGLYFIARLGMPPLERFFHKIHLDKFFNRIKERTGPAGRINLASPFSIAFGRMIGLRIPMLLIVAGKKKPWRLVLGVLLQSIIWDAVYISLGAIFGATVHIEPGYMLLISFGCITMIYLATFLIKRLIKRFRRPAAIAVELDDKQ
jgi:hypothetical protein